MQAFGQRQGMSHCMYGDINKVREFPKPPYRRSSLANIRNCSPLIWWFPLLPPFVSVPLPPGHHPSEANVLSPPCPSSSSCFNLSPSTPPLFPFLRGPPSLLFLPACVFASSPRSILLLHSFHLHPRLSFFFSLCVCQV